VCRGPAIQKLRGVSPRRSTVEPLRDAARRRVYKQIVTASASTSWIERGYGSASSSGSGTLLDQRRGNAREKGAEARSGK